MQETSLDRISKYVRDEIIYNNHLESNIKVEENIDPRKCLSSDRLDILAKYLFVKYSDLQLKSEYGKQIYLEHIRIINDFNEADGTGKCGPKTFLDNFLNVIQNIKLNDFNNKEYLLPVNDEYLLFDGAHRVAAALYFKKKISVMVIPWPAEKFDSKRLQKQGLSIDYLEALVLEYCKLKANTHVALLYPAAKGKKEEVDILFNNHCRVIYKKEILLYDEGPANLIKHLYSGEEWLGNIRNNYAGVKGKMIPCFPEGRGVVTCYFIEAQDGKDLDVLKAKIRSIYNIGKHSVHINDCHQETIEIANLLLNKNSVYALNNINTKKIGYDFFNKLMNYKNDIGKDSELYCLSGSSPLGIFGIRESNDIDYISYIEQSPINCGDNHESQVKYYNKNKDDLIFNPENFFWFFGIKFISLENIKQFKLNRGEKKDFADSRLIDSFTQNIDKKAGGTIYKIKISLSVLPIKMQGKTYLLIRKVYRKLKLNQLRAKLKKMRNKKSDHFIN